MWPAVFRITRINGRLEWRDAVRRAGQKKACTAVLTVSLCLWKDWSEKSDIKRRSTEGFQRSARAECLSERSTTEIQDVHKRMVRFQKLTGNLFHLTRAQRTPSAAATVQVSHGLPAVRFSCLLPGRGASFQDGVAAGKGFLCAPFWGVQICDYSAAWVSCTV